VACDTESAIRALDTSDADLARIASRARQRTLDEHTADRRAAELESAIQDASSRIASPLEQPQPTAVFSGTG
jgi:Glycosyl transferases group 1